MIRNISRAWVAGLPRCAANTAVFSSSTTILKLPWAQGRTASIWARTTGNWAPVRAMLGANAIIGRSTHSPEQALGAFRERADYIGFGPLFPTGTKPGRPAIGLEDIAGVRRQLPEEFPVFCIGGINGNTLPSVLEAGASRVVIVSWLLTHPDITETVAALRKRLGEA